MFGASLAFVDGKVDKYCEIEGLCYNFGTAWLYPIPIHFVVKVFIDEISCIS